MSQPAFQLKRRRAERGCRAGPNDVHDRLGSREVDFTIEKRPLGELARLGRPCAGAKNGFQNARCQEDAAVAGDLRHILACETRRAPIGGEQDLIENLFAVVDFPKHRLARHGNLAARFENAGDDRHRIRAGNANHRDRSFPGRRGNGRDCI